MESNGVKLGDSVVGMNTRANDIKTFIGVVKIAQLLLEERIKTRR